MQSPLYKERDKPGDFSDAASVTSTISEEDETHYALDGGILAERVSDGAMQYLVKWEGYDESYNTWEPEDNFDTTDTLKEWQEKKMRVTRGLTPEFDLLAFERRVQALREAFDEERRRMREKRRRLGVVVSDTSSSEDGEYEDEPPSPEMEGPPKERPRRPSSAHGDAHDVQDEEAITKMTERESTTSRTWTDQERRALEAGMIRANGPDWNKILLWFGPDGSINSDLKYKDKSDLQKMALKIKREFISAEREPPDWLGSVCDYKLKKANRRAQVVRPPTGSARQVSRLPKETLRGSESTMTREVSMRSSTPPIPRTSAGYRGTAQSKPIVSKSNSESRRSSNVDNSETRKSASKAPVSRIDQSAGTRKPDVANAVNTSSTATHPVRNSMAPQAGHLVPKPQPFFVNKPVPHRATALRGGGGHSDVRVRKAFYKTPGSLWHENKRRRIEPTPNLDNLVFLDPKTGRNPRRLSQYSRPNQAPDDLSQVRNREERQQQQQQQPLEIETDRQQNQQVAVPICDVPRLPPNEYLDPSRDTIEESLFLPESNGSSTVGSPTKPSNTEGVASPKTMAFSPSLGTDVVKHGQIVSKITRSLPFESNVHPSNESRALPFDTESSKVQSISSLIATGAGRQLTTPSVGGPFGADGRNQMSPPFRLSDRPSDFAKRKLFQYRVRQFLVKGELKLGDQGSDLAAVRLQEFDRPLQQRLLTIKKSYTECHYDLRRRCTAIEYQSLFPCQSADYVGFGYIVPMLETQRKIDHLADELAATFSAAVFFAQYFTMLVYPVGSPAWATIDGFFGEVPDGAVLRFVVRHPLNIDLSPYNFSGLEKWTAENPEQFKSVASGHLQDANKANLNVVFKDLFDIEYSRLVSPRRPVFFLCFSPTGGDYGLDDATKESMKSQIADEHDLVVDFLRENNAEVYSMHDQGSIEPVANGAWQYFVENVKSGIILFHYHCHRLDQIPWLGHLINRSSVSAWRISLSTATRLPIGPPFFSSPSSEHQHLIRLFPHGCVILLTHALTLYRPQDMLRILMWFRLGQLPTKMPGTWKLAVRPHIRSWLLELMDLYDRYPNLNIFSTGQGKAGKQIWADIYTEISLILMSPPPNHKERADTPVAVPREMNTMLWDPETPNADAALVAPAGLSKVQQRREWTISPNVSGTTSSSVNEHTERVHLNHEAINKNDDHLIAWFAEWSAVLGCLSHRQMMVALSPASDPPAAPAALAPVNGHESTGQPIRDGPDDIHMTGTGPPPEKRPDDTTTTAITTTTTAADFTARLKSLSRRWGNVEVLPADTIIRRCDVWPWDKLRATESARRKKMSETMMENA